MYVPDEDVEEGGGSMRGLGGFQYLDHQLLEGQARLGQGVQAAVRGHGVRVGIGGWELLWLEEEVDEKRGRRRRCL